MPHARPEAPSHEHDRRVRFRAIALTLALSACARLAAQPADYARELARGTLWEVGLRFVPGTVDSLGGRQAEGSYDSVEWRACAGLRRPPIRWLEWEIDFRQRPLPRRADEHVTYARFLLGAAVGTQGHLECLQRANPTAYGAIRSWSDTDARVGGRVLDDAHGSPIFFAPHGDVLVFLDERDDAQHREEILDMVRQRRSAVEPAVWGLLAETDLTRDWWKVEKGRKRFAKDPNLDAWHDGEIAAPMLPAIVLDAVESTSMAGEQRRAWNDKARVTMRYRFQSRRDAEMAASRLRQVFAGVKRLRAGGDQTARDLRPLTLKLDGVRVSVHDRDVRIAVPDDGESLRTLIDIALESPTEGDENRRGDWEESIRSRFAPAGRDAQ